MNEADKKVREYIAKNRDVYEYLSKSNRPDGILNQIVRIANNATPENYWRFSFQFEDAEVNVCAGNLDFIRSRYGTIGKLKGKAPVFLLDSGKRKYTDYGPLYLSHCISVEHQPDIGDIEFAYNSVRNLTWDDIASGTTVMTPEHEILWKEMHQFQKKLSEFNSQIKQAKSCGDKELLKKLIALKQEFQTTCQLPGK